MSSITILNKDNVPQGPFTRSEVADKLTRGEYTLESLAFIEGLSQWTPLREVLAKVDAVSAPQPAPFVSAPAATASPTAFAVSPAVSAPITPAYSYAATMQPPEHLVYAGFWLRFVAYIIDTILLNIVALCFGAIVGFVAGLLISLVDRDALQSGIFVLQCIVVVIVLVLVWLYFAMMESSVYQATLGKMALGLQVTDRQGNRIGFARASGRFFGKIVSGMILLIGYMMAGWTERKQALHDMLADTLVVRKPGA